MSRFLSDALGANEARFRQALMALERRSGHPNHDLRLSSGILQKVPDKLRQLGLDPDDTTAEELYHTLNLRLAEDDAKLIKKLRLLAAQSVNAEANLADGVISLIQAMHLEQDCLSLKHSVLKQQIHATPPKKTMKALNYRSIDSMLKLEPMALILLAINNYESEAYVSSFYSKYKKYSPANFETRKLAVISPKDKKWQSILEDIQAKTGLNMVASYELASIVLLPIKNDPKPGHLTLTVTSLLNEVSVILEVSSFLKLHQVSSDFGRKLLQIAEHEPFVEMKLLDHHVSWRAAQHILTSTDANIFAPHLSLDELKPNNLLARLDEVLQDLRFWIDNESLALVRSAEATSLNIRDVATNLASNLSFKDRQLQYFRHTLMQELTKLYLAPEELIDSLNRAPQALNNKQLVDNEALAVY